MILSGEHKRLDPVQHSTNVNTERRFQADSKWVLAIAAAAALILLYIYFVLTFGVNVPFWDDWQLLDEARLIYSGQAHWWTLITSKHNEHLMGTAFLIQGLQLLLTDFDYRQLLVTGVVLQIVSFGVFSGAVWRFIPAGKRPFWFAISCVIWFSLCQYKNLLWPFQTAWFLVTALLAVVIACLERAVRLDESGDNETGTLIVGAAFAAVLASFSQLQGIIIWPAGAVYLISRRGFQIPYSIRDRLLRNWLLCTLVGGVLVVYVWLHAGGGGAQGTGKFSLSTMVQIALGIHGDFFGDLGLNALICLGLIMLAFTAFALIQVYLSKQKSIYALPVTLIVFGLCFVGMVSFGRASFGLGPASDSHYTAYLILTYFGVLTILMTEDRTLSSSFPVRWVTKVYCVTILLAGFTSDFGSVLQGVAWRSDQGLNAALLLKYQDEPDFVLARTLFGDPAMVRRNADFLQVHHLGSFGDANAVPMTAMAFRAMPKSIVAMIARHPESANAIQRAWQVYQIGSDLRSAFNPESEDFAKNLISWCGPSSQPGGGHYLNQYLLPYANDYTALVKAGL